MSANLIDFVNLTGAIQLALTPAFLLTGIAGLLNVMTGRLSRIIDRSRKLRSQSDMSAHNFGQEVRCLKARKRYTSIAITSCTIAALLICLVIAVLFLEELLSAPLHGLIAVLFASAMIAMVVGLGYFLREVQISMRNIYLDDSSDG